MNEQVVGPALAGITKRRPISWLIPWIKNSSKVVASGDEYAVKLYNKYKQAADALASQLSDKEITSIVAYITSEEGKATAGTGIAPGQGDKTIVDGTDAASVRSRCRQVL